MKINLWMKTNLWMYVTAICLWNNAKSQTNFPDDGLINNLITKIDTIDKNNKINKKELAEFFEGGKAGSDENAALIIKMIDENGDNEISKDELLNMAKKIIELYINIFDLNNDNTLSEKEFVGQSVNVNGMMEDVNFLLDLADINKDGLYSADDGQIMFIHEEEQIKNYSRILEIIKKTLDKNDDGRFSKKEIKDFVTTAIKIIDSNQDGEITKEEAFQTLEQNNISKKTLDFLRNQTEDKTIIDAFKDVFHKIDAKNKISKNDGKLNADELTQLLNKPITELKEIGEGLNPLVQKLVISFLQDSPVNTAELLDGVKSFLKNAEFKKSSSEDTNKESVSGESEMGSGDKNSSDISHVNVILVLSLALILSTIIYK